MQCPEWGLRRGAFFAVDENIVCGLNGQAKRIGVPSPVDPDADFIASFRIDNDQSVAATLALDQEVSSYTLLHSSLNGHKEVVRIVRKPAGRDAAGPNQVGAVEPDLAL